MLARKRRERCERFAASFLGSGGGIPPLAGEALLNRRESLPKHFDLVTQDSPSATRAKAITPRYRRTGGMREHLASSLGLALPQCFYPGLKPLVAQARFLCSRAKCIVLHLRDPENLHGGEGIRELSSIHGPFRECSRNRPTTTPTNQAQTGPKMTIGTIAGGVYPGPVGTGSCQRGDGPDR